MLFSRRIVTLSWLGLAATATGVRAQTVAPAAAVDGIIDPSDYLAAPDAALAAHATSADTQDSAVQIEELEARIGDLELALAVLSSATPTAASSGRAIQRRMLHHTNATTTGISNKATSSMPRPVC